jgi:hypothetical protein
MKAGRYVVGAIGFLLAWLVVAFVVGGGVAMLFPPSSGGFIAGFSLDWRNLPGNVLGLLAGIQSYRASVRGPKKLDDRN